jgi:hypothetical protein
MQGCPGRRLRSYSLSIKLKHDDGRGAWLPLFQAAATISPSFSLSNDNNQTYNTTINFAKAA